MTNAELELITNLLNNNFEINTLKQEKESFADYDKEIIEFMEKEKCDIVLHNTVMARNWYFSNINALVNYFSKGGLVGYDDAETKIV